MVSTRIVLYETLVTYAYFAHLVVFFSNRKINYTLLRNNVILIIQRKLPTILLFS